MAKLPVSRYYQLPATHHRPPWCPMVPQVPRVHSTTTLGIPVEIQEAHRDGATPDAVRWNLDKKSHRKKP